MFIAKFTQTQGEPFTADKNGNYPFIGNVMAGKARGTLFNGTMAQREGIEVQVLYLCENFVDPEYPDNQQVKIVGKVGMLEYIEFCKVLGEGKLLRENVQVAEGVAEEHGI